MPSSRPEMGSRQILDALTAHIALYHSSSRPPPSNPNPRKTILRWFSSLSVHQRQASLTVVDPDFAKILLQMAARLETNGHGFFFLLPDLPSAADPTLPSLCYRPSRGLLSRASASNELERLISSAVRLFGSREGEPGAEYALDSMTVSEDLVKDAEQFVAAMDGISDGGFLREARSNVSQVPWEELEWLKGKGYYSVEAFLANRLELALRLSWLDCHGGKKQRVVKSKDKIGVAAIAANVFRRKMGCLDWWLGLDPGTRRKIILNCLCKGAKSLVKEMIEGQTALNNASVFLRVGSKLPVRYGSFPPCQRVRELCGSIDPEFLLGLMPLTLHKKPCRLANPLNHLLVLREVCDIVLASQHVEFEKETLIFSTLGSVHCISDCMLRRVRGILMSLSSECIKVELMEDSRLKMPLSKTEVNSAQGCRKGKKKGCNSKRLNSTTNLSRDHGRGSAYMENCISKATPWGNIPTAKASGKKKPVGTSAPESSLSKEAFVTQVGVEHAVVGDHEVNMRKKGKRKGAKNKRASACWNENLAIENSVYNPTESSTPSSILHDGVENSMQSSDSLASGTTSVSLLVNSNVEPDSGYQNAANKTPLESETGMQATQADVLHSTVYATCPDCPQNLNKLESNDALENFSENPLKDQGLPHELTSLGPVLNSDTSCSEATAISVTTFVREASDDILGSKIVESSRPEREHSAFCCEHEVEHHSSKLIIDSASRLFQNDASNEHEANQREGSECNVHSQASFIGVASYEWPSISSVHFSSSHSQHLPPATDRLHLDVGHNVRNNIFQSSVSATANHQAINASAEGGCRRVIPCITSPMSSDWPPMVRSCGRFSQSVSLNLDTLYNSRLQSPFCTGLNARKMQITGSDNERKCSGDILDLCDFKNALEAVDDAESYWMSEDESDMPTFSGRDYNQFFGGGVMYWNTSDHVGASFSHPPSYSSEDSSWAWHEADLNKAIDDMVGMSGLSGSHSTSGVASPPAAPFCSPFDNLGPGKQSLGLAFPGNDASGLQSPSSTAEIPEGKIVVSLNNSASGSEGVKGDSLPYPVLPPIIIPSISRKGSRSEFMLSQDHKSPRVPSTRRDFPRIKRPPSPVVLCVPRAPRPPPPSPVGESRKHRGFPVVRSGSSSPRNWGMRSWHHEEHTSARAHICLDGAEVVWASLENRKHAGAPLMQPVPGSLLQDRLIAISQLSRDQEHPDAAFPVQPAEVDCPSRKVSLSMMHGILHEEIDCFCKKVAAENLIRKPYINWAVKRVAKSLQVLWPRSRTSVFGSNATGLSLPSSDVDLVVCLPPVRNLEPIKEAGILEGRNGIKETCLQHAARYLGNQEWVKNDSLKTIENTAIPLIMLIAEVPHDVIDSNGIASIAHTPEVQSDLINNVPNNLSHLGPCGTEGLPLPNFSKTIIDNSPNAKSIHLDISFKSPTHTGLQTTKLVRELTEQFPASIPLALVLKQFLADRSLDRSYSGGLSSYCLVLLIIRFLQHELHLGRPNSQNFGSLLMDFLYFFGNVFDPRQMRISIQGSGIYMNREKGHSIDPIHIDDPLCPTNNVGKNCFRIHQCIKAFADAYSVMDTQLLSFSGDSDLNMHAPFKLLQKIIPSIDYK